MALTSSFIPMESAAQLLSVIMLLTEVNLVSSNTKTAIYCFPLPQAALLSCETGLILVTQAHMGNVEERAEGFCESPRNEPEHNKYDVGNMTNMMRKYCNTFMQCGLDTMRGLSLPHARYLVVEYWCTETDPPNSAYMNLFDDLTAFGNEIIIQTMGYPSSEIAATDISCDITVTEPIPSIRMDIYDFSSNSSENSSYCLEWNGELKKCAIKGGIISTFISEGGDFVMKKMTGEPLTIRLMMILTAIETQDGLGLKSPHSFNITCQPKPIEGDSSHPLATKARENFPIVIGSVLGVVFIAANIGIIIYLKQRNTAKKCEGSETSEDPKQPEQVENAASTTEGELNGMHNNPHDYVNATSLSEKKMDRTKNSPHDYVNAATSDGYEMGRPVRPPDYEEIQTASAYGSLQKPDEKEHSYQGLATGNQTGRMANKHDYVNATLSARKETEKFSSTADYEESLTGSPYRSLQKLDEPEHSYLSLATGDYDDCVNVKVKRG